MGRRRKEARSQMRPFSQERVVGQPRTTSTVWPFSSTPRVALSSSWPIVSPAIRGEGGQPRGLRRDDCGLC